MFIFDEPEIPDLVAEFGHQAYYHLIHTLFAGLPAPPTNDLEALARRNHAAIARIAALCPANPTEAEIAGLYVAASEQWKEALRLAQLPETPLKQAIQCRNQANAMMRQAQGALRLLLRMQAVREKRESTTQSCDRAARTEHWNTTLMAEALGIQPSQAAQPAPPPPPPPEPASVAEPRLDPLAAAKEYTILYPQRAELITRLGRVPDDTTFGPPDAAVVRTLIAARGTAFPTINHHTGEPGS